MVNVSKRLSACDIDTTLVFFAECDVRRSLIDPYAKSFQFRLNDSLISKGLVHVQDDEDEMAGFGNGNDLTTSTFSIFCTLDDTRKIQHLDLRTIVLHLAWHCCESCELISGSF